jgi:thymidylate kinase
MDQTGSFAVIVMSDRFAASSMAYFFASAGA